MKKIWLFLKKCLPVKREKIKFILFSEYSLLQNVVCLIIINSAILYMYFEVFSWAFGISSSSIRVTNKCLSLENILI